MSFFQLEKYLWAVVAVYWIVAAFFVKKTVRREFGASRILYIVIWSVACILLFTTDFSFRFLYIAVLPQGSAWQCTGLFICILGLSFSVWARIYLGKNWSGNITIKKDHELITSGPYSITRNPIYSGFLFGFTGCAMTSGLLKGYLSLPFIFAGILIKVTTEEKFMLEVFGTTYARYKMEVKKIIPFIY